MKHALALAAVTAAWLAAPALAQTAPPPAISVTGEANVSVAPDQAQIDGGVTSDAKTAREASDANNAAMGKVLLALKGAGIEEKDYQTSRLSLQPQFATSPRTAERTAGIVSFRASNRVTVKIRDVTKVANVIDVLVSAGANDIGGISFTVTQASKHLDEAREKAIADARRKAEIYAKAVGVALGEPISVEEGGPPGPLFRGKVAAPMAAGAPVAQGEETLSVTVNVSWAIKAKE
ncbi:SIMPL domain-containing protein [Bradyrhizobium sp. CCBAU 051011]|uniref:SIMPL domain-containing protein n=1 Tax=Bradyrhizobium sp. CCBAU 051011 TaxID=858422 RepID=UPI0013740273|nr:SIMPL domain-containing protein [Bradyrhizobium sp. CCBAU 051011]QHO78728.1 SIMPL domain-containing protein [Bradyrhizobium sp. CCBAU 051011]